MSPDPREETFVHPGNEEDERILRHDYADALDPIDDQPHSR